MERLYDVLERSHLCSLNRFHGKHGNRLPVERRQQSGWVAGCKNARDGGRHLCWQGAPEFSELQALDLCPLSQVKADKDAPWPWAVASAARLSFDFAGMRPRTSPRCPRSTSWTSRPRDSGVFCVQPLLEQLHWGTCRSQVANNKYVTRQVPVSAVARVVIHHLRIFGTSFTAIVRVFVFFSFFSFIFTPHLPIVVISSVTITR